VSRALGARSGAGPSAASRIGDARRQAKGADPRVGTNRSLDEAINMYHSAGYREVAAFKDGPYAHHWFEKRIGRGHGRRR
jgi:hypothetical protein